jgi:hypothetical protein
VQEQTKAFPVLKVTERDNLMETVLVSFIVYRDTQEMHPRITLSLFTDCI